MLSALCSSRLLFVIAPLEKVLFQVTGSSAKIFLLQADSSETERLAVWDGGFTMHRVATIHAEILMFVRGVHMKVCTDLPVLEVDCCVQKRHLFS